MATALVLDREAQGDIVCHKCLATIRVYKLSKRRVLSVGLGSLTWGSTLGV